MRQAGYCETILDAERKSDLYVDPVSSNKIDHRRIGDTWYPKLVQLLTEAVDKEGIASLFANVTFIIFNYDRCIEHFLRDALSTYYALPLPQIEEILKKATFIHPYGTVGRLSWEARDGIVYGAKIDAETLLEIASQLKTFSEQSTDKNVIRQLGDAMREASTIVFLGFAFHEQNMKLLAPKERSKSSRVFATAFSVSDSDSDAIRLSILDTIQVPSTAIRVEIRNDLKCAGLFEQYWRSLRAS